MPRAFRDRTSAGRALALKLNHLRGHPLIVLGLPRGGMPVAYEVTLEGLDRSDPRYRFPVPAIDTKDYRKIPYWSRA